MRARFRVLRLACCAGILLTLTAGAVGQQSAPESPSAAPGVTSDLTNARKLMQQGKIDEAIAELQTIESRNPSAKGLAQEIGTAYYKKSDYPKAIEYLKKATAADSTNDEATQLLGLSYYLNGHPVEAIPLLEKVQGWYPRANIDAAYILGVCYIQTKNYDQ